MVSDDDTFKWLVEGDVSIQYQAYRDLKAQYRPELQEKIPAEGYGKRFLSKRGKNGHWGKGFYQPKWISSHYILLDIKNLAPPRDNEKVQQTIQKILDENLGPDGGVNPSHTIRNSDVCINGMFLNYATYFETPETQLEPIIDFLLSVRMSDGGFNCQSNRGGAVHSSLHSTISVLEGLHEYLKRGYRYRADEVKEVEPDGREFILQHRLYRSDHTGETIDKRMLMLSYPSRWRYDILRALDYFQNCDVMYDDRMSDAIAVLLRKRRRDGTWPVQARHAGTTHFEMEKTGGPSRWNTLRALRVFKKYPQ